MATVDIIPFRPSETNYTLTLPFDNVPILIDVHWNDVEQAWYIDFREEDETLMAGNIKVVLGVNLARRSNHPFFRSNLFVAFDTGPDDLDPGFDDLGVRVIVQRFTIPLLIGEQQ